MIHARTIAAMMLAASTFVVFAPSAAAQIAPHGGSGRLTLAGQVGPLLFDSSTESDVVAFAGQPDATATANFDASPQDPNYQAMGARETFLHPFARKL